MNSRRQGCYRYFQHSITLLIVSYCMMVPMMCFAKDFCVATFNIENGGTQINFNQVVEAIKQSGADVVGIQEAWGHIDQLAHALQWNYFNRNQHIISRYPLIETKESHGTYLYIEVEPGKYVAMANTHLPDEAYGPDAIDAGVPVNKVIANERKFRLKFIMPVIRKLLSLAQHKVPVFLTGDFNSPSHLDWRAVAWPVTSTLEAYGFQDAYRATHCEVTKFPGFTWPAMRPFASLSYDDYNPSPKDHADRIDFIFSHGEASVTQSKILGESHSRYTDTVVTPWPSDHRAVVAQFKITPQPLPLLALKHFNDENSSQLAPQIKVSKQTIRVGQAFAIAWQHAPGFRFDYVRISPVHSKKLTWGEAVRLYTRGKRNGMIVLNRKNAQGNWLLWHRGTEGRWPLAPGLYDIKLMLDDGMKVLASTKVCVHDKKRSVLG